MVTTDGHNSAFYLVNARELLDVPGEWYHDIESRRMQDMMKMYGMAGMDPNMFGAEGQTLVLNANNDLVKYVAEHADGENTKIICEQLYDLAMLSHAPLSPEQMTGFIALLL